MLLKISDISNQILNINNLIHNIEDSNDYIEKSVFYENIIILIIT